MQREFQILIIEDHPEQAHLMELILKRHGQPFAVHILHDPEEGLAHLQNAPVDALVLDYSLPKMSGLEVLQEIKKRHSGLPVIMVTGQGDERIAVEAMRHGVYDYLVKTKDFLDLLPRVVTRAIEERQLSSRLEQSEQRYFALFDKASIAIFIAEADSYRLRQANGMALKLTGYPDKALLEMSFLQICAARSLQEVEGFLARIKQEGQANLDQVMLVSQDHHLIPVDLSGSLVSIGDRQVIQCFVRDISEKLKMQRQLLLSRQRLISLFDGITDPISVQDRDHNLIMGNKRYLEITAGNTPGLVGCKCHKALFGSDFPCSNCPAFETYRTGESRFIEIIHEGRTYDLWTFPMAGLDGRPEFLVEYAKDVTEQKEIEKQLIKSEKLASIGLLSSGIAHELRNPLNIIETARYSIEDLLNHAQPEIDRKLDIIKKNVRRASVIIENLLQFSRHSEYERERVDVEKLVDTTLSLVEKETAVRDIHLQKAYAGVPKVYFSLDSLKQVFLNIIYNAIQAMPNGGVLRIVTSASSDGGWVDIEFTDNGVGISSENLSHIFTPFFSTKRDSGGTGLGLYLSYTIIKREGGDILARSREGSGTTFTVKLPVAQTPGTPGAGEDV
ncbi:MAG TPA: response regulator [bacterium]|nr:response regulator [bacterium]HQG44556.1 response regulator [bacterium]HQI48190.1 response regulator [bacterium]HQJ64549.1 response regulator [bacterium]